MEKLPPMPDSFFSRAYWNRPHAQEVWDNAMRHLILDEATVLQLKGGRELLRAVAVDVSLVALAEAQRCLTSESARRATAEYVNAKYPPVQKRVRNEVTLDYARCWFDRKKDAWMTTQNDAQYPSAHSSAVHAAYAMCGERTVLLDKLYAQIFALKDAPTILVDASDPRSEVSE